MIANFVKEFSQFCSYRFGFAACYVDDLLRKLPAKAMERLFLVGRFVRFSISSMNESICLSVGLTLL